MKIGSNIWSFSFALLVLASCGTSRQAQQGGVTDLTELSSERAVMEYKQKVVENAQTATCLTAKLSDIKFNGKGIPLGSGELRMKRDEVIQLMVVVPFLGEVGRMEFTPTEVLVVNRKEKEYVRVSYSDVDFLKNAELNFQSLQSLFWNELFIPGQERVDKSGLRNFSISSSGDHTLLSLKSAPKLDYFFLTRTKDGVIDRTSVSPKTLSDPTEFVWKYSDFSSFNGHLFPGQMDLSITGLKKKFALSFSLGSLSTNSSWKTRTEIPAKYTQRTVDDVLKRFSSFSGF